MVHCNTGVMHQMPKLNRGPEDRYFRNIFADIVVQTDRPLVSEHGNGHAGELLRYRCNIEHGLRSDGDSDRDGDVDGKDYGRFGMSFLQPSGSSGYDEELDFDGDGDVDGQDYARFGRSFLKRLDFS